LIQLDSILKEIEERHKQQDVCVHDFEELVDAYDGTGLGVFFCKRCNVLKHELERRKKILQEEN